MKLLITGIDDDGRSAVLVERDVEAPRAESFADVLSTTSESPPPPRPRGKGEFFPADVWAPGLPPKPGMTSWQVLRFVADDTFPVHQTDTIDFDTVLTGSIDLLLDDGDHPLSAGDCVVVTGVDHGWRVGSEGATLAVVMLGSRLSANDT
jgi:hypothetical protein